MPQCRLHCGARSEVVAPKCWTSKIPNQQRQNKTAWTIIDEQGTV